MSSVCKLFGHKWNGCKCIRCGETRNEQHDWDFCRGICKRCGARQPEQHDWDGYKCRLCGKMQPISEITDQSILALIAKTEKDVSTRREAVKKLEKQLDLIEIAKNDIDMWVRVEAVKKLENQSVLIEIAKMDTEYLVRKTAIEEITDQSVLTDIAIHEKEYFPYTAALDKIKDVSLIYNLAIKADSSDNAVLALQKTEDEKVLVDVVKNASYERVRAMAITRLGGYVCKSCKKAVWPDSKHTVSCICPHCQSENHLFKRVFQNKKSTAIWESADEYDLCERCGKKENFQETFRYKD